MTDQDKKNLFLEMDRDIGTLVSSLNDSMDGVPTSDSDYQMIKDLCARLDSNMIKLQELCGVK